MIVSRVRSSQPGFRLDRCENGQMVYLSLCNYVDADDRDLLFAARRDERARCEPRHAEGTGTLNGASRCH